MDNEKEISFGAFDSELMHQEIFIPEGFTATIEGDKIILTRKDSEDERIRKELIGYIVEEVGLYPGEDRKEHKWLRWLEKQGEHKKFRDSIQVGDEVTRNSDGVIVNLSQLKRVAKPADKGKPKFNVRDWVIDKQGIVHQIANVIENVTYHTYGYDIVGGGYFNDNTEGVRLWTIQDAKDGDVLYSLDSKQPFIFKHRKPNEQAKVYCGINIYGKFFVGNTKDCIITTDKYIPAAKVQRDFLFSKMKEAGYEWDVINLKLNRISQRMISAEAKEALYDKPAWSDEDMKEVLRTEYEKGRADAIVQMQKKWSNKEKLILNDIIEATERSNIFMEDYQRELVDWLKSLRPQNTWKPSEELDEASYQVGIKRVLDNPESYGLTKYNWKPSDKQMKQLGWVAEQNKDNMIGKELMSLYQDLKKLKG